MIDKLAKKCVDNPECVVAIFGDPPGPNFAATIALAQDSFSAVFCDSPSGAFLDQTTAALD